MNEISKRLVILETQVKRIISDIESEKGTRSRSHVHLDQRLQKLERIVYMATGALAALQIGLTLLKI